MRHAPYIAAATRNELGESPLWCAREQALWWLDARRPSLWRLDLALGGIRSWPLPKLPAALALVDEGGLLIVFRNRFAVLPYSAGPLCWIDVPGRIFSDERFNDGKVDRHGRFWVGTIDRKLSKPIGCLYCLNGPGYSLKAEDEGFALSNGIGWSPDGRTLYFAESHERRLYCYAFDPDSGLASNRRVLVQLSEGEGIPDGLTVDSAGGVWVAIYGRGCVRRYLPDGVLDRTIQLPVSQPTSCTFGGPDMHTLFITTSRFGLDDARLLEQPAAGAILAVDVPETGVAETSLKRGIFAAATQIASAT